LPSILQLGSRFVTDVLRRLGFVYFGPLLIDRGHGLFYDVERDITWLQDANYAKTVGRTPDGQLTWNDAMAWVHALRYRGIGGWRLPSAFNADGSGPCLGDNCQDSEIGHLFFVANKRMSPPHLAATNFEPFSIYWFSTEASATEAYGFRLTGLKQGKLAKNPWVVDGLGSVPLTDKVLAWPVHDGDVGASFITRLVRAMLELFRFSRRGQHSSAPARRIASQGCGASRCSSVAG
jgi:hypothetical protein